MLGRMESALAGLVTLLFSVVLIAGVSVSVTRGAATGQLPRGGGAGIRTRRTQASDDAWRAAHTAALPLVNRLGWVATGAVAAALIAQTLFGGMWGMAAAGAGMALEIGVLLAAARRADRAARAAEGP